MSQCLNKYYFEAIYAIYQYKCVVTLLLNRKLKIFSNFVIVVDHNRLKIYHKGNSIIHMNKIEISVLPKYPCLFKCIFTRY